MTEFAGIRRTHQGFTGKLDSDNRTDILKGYLSDLERFAVGCNHKAYTVDIVNSMSGGMLVNQYNKYFKEFITERRRLTSLEANVKPWNMYNEYEKMMKQVFELRGLEWEEPILRTGYIFVPGTRADRCVIVAHADTYFDEVYQKSVIESNVNYKDGFYYSESKVSGIGADDRAGCAMLWLLRNSGHSLLILDGEEHGQIGAHYLKESNPDLFQEINDHCFIIQLDRRGSNDYKYYSLPVSDGFIKYIEKSTGYTLAQGKGKTDICTLCTIACGVNLSVGYYDEHKPTERLCYKDWLNTYNIVKNMLDKPLKKYKNKTRVVQ